MKLPYNDFWRDRLVITKSGLIWGYARKNESDILESSSTAR
jgi:hypothetical protein